MLKASRRCIGTYLGIHRICCSRLTRRALHLTGGYDYPTVSSSVDMACEQATKEAYQDTKANSKHMLLKLAYMNRRRGGDNILARISTNHAPA